MREIITKSGKTLYNPLTDLPIWTLLIKAETGLLLLIKAETGLLHGASRECRQLHAEGALQSDFSASVGRQFANTSHRRFFCETYSHHFEAVMYMLHRFFNHIILVS